MTTPSWATVNVKTLGSQATPYAVQNLVDGQWQSAAKTLSIPHPLDRDKHDIFTIPETTADEIQPFVESMRKVPKSGLHNPLKRPERYVEYGEISRKVSCLGLLDTSESLMMLHGLRWHS
jgi:1-pyrroline-5-carboxylate dehydrogenase